MTTEDITKPMVAAGHAAAEGVSKAWGAAKDKLEDTKSTGVRLIRTNVEMSILGSCGIGFLLGAVVGWIAVRDVREDRCWCAHRFLKRWGHKLNLD